MLFVIIEVNGIERYVSDQAISTDMLRQWKGYVLSFSNPKYTLSNKYGGRVKLDFGSLEMSPDLFNYPERRLDPPPDWPPPITCPIDIWYSDLNDDFFGAGTHERLFSGTAHLSKFDMKSVTYDIWDEESNVYVLATGTDYDGNEVDLPRVFGQWDYLACKRMEDYNTGGNDYPTYHTGYIATTGYVANVIQTIEDNGSGKVRFHTSAAHGYTGGEIITTEDVNFYYWDTSAITYVDTDTFDKLSLDYVSTPTTSDYSITRIQSGASWIQNSGHCFSSGQFRVYDDGVPITGNVNILTGLEGRPYQFYLDVNPVGTVTCSGTGTHYGANFVVSLLDVVQWASSYLSFALMGHYDTAADNIPVSWLQDNQIRMLDFIDNLCASFHWWFFKAGSNEGYLYNMIYASTVIPDFVFREEQSKYVSIEYTYDNPVMNVSTSWAKRESTEDNSGKVVKETESAITELSTQYDYGDEQSVDWYCQIDPSTAATTVAETLILMNKVNIKLEVALSPPIPEIGDLVRVIDRSTLYDLTTQFRVRNKTYDFSKLIATYEGEGQIWNFKEADEIGSNPPG